MSDSRSACEDCQVGDASFEIRPARDDDRLPLAVLFAAVAEERNGIGAEPPVDVDARAASWTLDGALVAVAGDDIVGWLHVAQTPFGFGEIGMLVAREWRGRGVGSALLAAAIEWARPSCEAFPACERGALGRPRDGAPALTCLSALRLAIRRRIRQATRRGSAARQMVPAWASVRVPRTIAAILSGGSRG